MSLLGIAASVVMVGHSLFGTDGPDMLQAALRAGTGEGTVRAQIINGAPLKYNWDRSDTAEGIDARLILPEGGTTHLILTEAIPLANHIKWSDSDVYAQAFAGLAASANPDVHIYVQETWHSLQSGTGVAVDHDAKADIPWRTRLDQDLQVWEGLVKQVAAATRSDRATVGLIPAGQAMARLYDEIAAGDKRHTAEPIGKAAGPVIDLFIDGLYQHQGAKRHRHRKRLYQNGQAHGRMR